MNLIIIVSSLKQHSISAFFKNKHGKISIVQWPNIFVLAWVGLSGLSKVANDDISPCIALLATLSLAIWAYLEITAGISPFRRVLGAVVLTFIVLRIINALI